MESSIDYEDCSMFILKSLTKAYISSVATMWSRTIWPASINTFVILWFQDAQVAQHLLTNPETFQETAKQWTRLYATEEKAQSILEKEDPAVNRLCEMGFDKKKVKDALRNSEFNEQNAIEYLLSHWIRATAFFWKGS